MDGVGSQATAAALLSSVGLLVRRFKQVTVPGELTIPERSALSRLDRGGPATSAALAKLEQISPQSMGATLGGLETRGLIERTPDDSDGRRVVLSVTDAGREVLRDRRSARAEQLAQVLDQHFSTAERAKLAAIAPLLDRLADNL
jgi:DNA-binding MarR family transcriptional regulator